MSGFALPLSIRLFARRSIKTLLFRQYEYKIRCWTATFEVIAPHGEVWFVASSEILDALMRAGYCLVLLCKNKEK